MKRKPSQPPASEPKPERTITHARIFDGANLHNYVVGEGADSPCRGSDGSPRTVVSIARPDPATVTVTRDDGEEYTFVYCPSVFEWRVDPQKRPLDEHEARALAMFLVRQQNGEQLPATTVEKIHRLQQRAANHGQMEAVQTSSNQIIARRDADESEEGPIVRDEHGKAIPTYRDDDGNPISDDDMGNAPESLNAEGVSPEFVKKAVERQAAEADETDDDEESTRVSQDEFEAAAEAARRANKE